MNVVMNIEVGNEAELIEQNIQYHLALGVDAFVITDMFSRDETPKILKKYEGDSRFLIRYAEQSEVLTDAGICTSHIGSWMVDAAKNHFHADWIIRLDADEFLYPATGNIKSVLVDKIADVIEVERRNIIFSANQSALKIPESWAALSQYLIVANPLHTTREMQRSENPVPINLTKVVSKTIARAQCVYGFSVGAHAALDENGECIASQKAEDVISLQFWFTTFRRFYEKVNTIRQFMPYIRKTYGPDVAWQWSHWMHLGDEGKAALIGEFQKQFPPDVTLTELRKKNIVSFASEAFDTLKFK